MSPEAVDYANNKLLRLCNILVAFWRFSLLPVVRELYGDDKSITSQNTSIRGLVKVLVPFRVL